MALAEVFSSNCGVLALDEPTTNLDETHITNLSQSLLEWVSSCKIQTNKIKCSEFQGKKYYIIC